MVGNVEQDYTVSVRVDEKGRLTIPLGLRKALGIKPGDALYCRREGEILQCAKAVNPFDVLVEQAIEEYYAGQTISLDEFAKQVSEGADG